MEWPAHLPLERGRGVSMTALLLIIGNEKKKKKTIVMFALDYIRICEGKVVGKSSILNCLLHCLTNNFNLFYL